MELRSQLSYTPKPRLFFGNRRSRKKKIKVPKNNQRKGDADDSSTTAAAAAIANKKSKKKKIKAAAAPIPKTIKDDSSTTAAAAAIANKKSKKKKLKAAAPVPQKINHKRKRDAEESSSTTAAAAATAIANKKMRKKIRKAEKRAKRKPDAEDSSATTPKGGKHQPKLKNAPPQTPEPAKKHKKRKATFTLPPVNGRIEVPWNTAHQKDDDVSLEMAQFASYVRLDAAEESSRASFIDVVRSVVGKQYPQATTLVFGSFATLEVCNFASDVDITICNAIEDQEPSPRKPKAKSIDSIARLEAEAKAKEEEEKAQRLKQKWLSAMEQVDASNEASSGSGTEEEPFVVTASDDDTADPLKRDRLDSLESTVHLNIVSSPATPNNNNNRASSLVRRQIQDCLSSLRKRLYNLKSIQGIQFIANARVPILKVRTCFAMQADICIQEGQETDTRLFASDCVTTYGDTFSHVILVLKMLLYQQGLDEPFSGGLGSFKLYALLSLYLTRCAVTTTAQVLVGFLQSFAQYRRDIYLFDLEHAANTQVDLTNVFRLNDIIALFTACRKRLLQHNHLAVLFDVPKLELDRSRLRRLCDTDGAMTVDVKKWCASPATKMTTTSPVAQALAAAR